MAVGDLYRIALGYRVHGQLNVNVMAMKQIADAAVEDASDVAAKIITPLAQTWANYLAGIAFDKNFEVKVDKIARLTSDQGTAQLFADLTYQNNVSLPTVNAITYSLYTGLAGPTRRGRIFLGGIPVDSVLNSVITNLGLTRFNNFNTAFSNNFLGESAASGFQIGVFSRSRYNIVSNPFDEYWKPCNRLVIKNAVGTMHSRKIGVGG